MSIQANLIKLYSRAAIKRHGLDEDQLVRHLRRVFNNTPTLRWLPRGVRLSHLDTTMFKGDRVGCKDPRMTVMYIHGGAYIGGVTRTYHNFAGKLATELDGEVYLPRYPFCPEEPFPAAVNRCFDAYRFLLDEGKEPGNLVIAGDSAGGGLTLALLLKLRDEGLPLPRCAVTFSPGATAFPDEDLLARMDASDAMLSADIIRTVIDIYIPNLADRSNPYASPALGDYHGLPPIMITVSNEEVLYGDAVLVREAAQKAGVEVEWLEREGVFHVWPIMVPFLPEANEDMKDIVAFIKRHG